MNSLPFITLFFLLSHLLNMANLTKQPSLLSLPNEIIDQIFEECHVSAHFNLALACRRLAGCGKPFLQRHKAAYQEHGVVSDLEPLTLPLLLQKVVRDPYVAWNVRSIEIWATRDDWYAWGSIPLEVPAHIAARPMSIRPYGYSYYWDETFQNEIDDPPHLTEEQLDVYHDLLREHAHFDEGDLEEARADFSDGADFFYKILLILLCPRLNSFKHVNINDPFICDNGRYVEQHTASSKVVIWKIFLTLFQKRDVLMAISHHPKKS